MGRLKEARIGDESEGFTDPAYPGERTGRKATGVEREAFLRGSPEGKETEAREPEGADKADQEEGQAKPKDRKIEGLSEGYLCGGGERAQEQGVFADLEGFLERKASGLKGAALVFKKDAEARGDRALALEKTRFVAEGAKDLAVDGDTCKGSSRREGEGVGLIVEEKGGVGVEGVVGDPVGSDTSALLRSQPDRGVSRSDGEADRVGAEGWIGGGLYRKGFLLKKESIDLRRPALEQGGRRAEADRVVVLAASVLEDQGLRRERREVGFQETELNRPASPGGRKFRDWRRSRRSGGTSAAFAVDLDGLSLRKQGCLRRMDGQGDHSCGDQGGKAEVQGEGKGPARRTGVCFEGGGVWAIRSGVRAEAKHPKQGKKVGGGERALEIGGGDRQIAWRRKRGRGRRGIERFKGFQTGESVGIVGGRGFGGSRAEEGGDRRRELIEEQEAEEDQEGKGGEALMKAEFLKERERAFAR